MRHSNPTTNTHIYYFDGISDTSKYISELTKLNQKAWWTSERVDFWSGNITFREAFEKFSTGDDELAKRIEDVEIDEIKSERIVSKYVNDIMGVIPHVPNAIIGLPQSMINITRNKVKTNNKIITLLYDISASCNIDENKYHRVSKLFLNIVDKIEKMGYRCNIYLTATQNCKNIKPYCNHVNSLYMIKLKDCSEPFNKYKCSFCLGHVAMFRKIIFRLMELNPYTDIYNDSYGRIVGYHEHKDLVEQGLKLNNLSLQNSKMFRIYDYIDSDEKDILDNIIDNHQN